MKNVRKCLNCTDEFEGRVDKKFCSVYCKSNYHYELKRELEDSFYLEVDRQLKVNRRLLKLFNRAGKSTVVADELINKGFNPGFFTHYWKNRKQDVYLFCYEFGFLRLVDSGKVKYVLVKWQRYMKR